MNFKFFTQIGIIISIFITINSYAEDKIPCPDIEMIRGAAQKIDAAGFSEKGYFSYTSTPAFEENNLLWKLSTQALKVQSFEEAVKVGKKVVAETTLRNETYAIRTCGGWMCTYGPGMTIAVGNPTP